MALDRSTMITAALELLDEAGLDGLTLRRLASKLNVQAPAIYWHFKNKQELLDEMASAVLRAGVQQMPMSVGVKWDKWAMAYGRGLRRILLLHRDGAKMLSGTRLTDNSLYAPMESALRTLVDAGFAPKLSMVALSTIYSYVVGFVIEEQAVCRVPVFATNSTAHNSEAGGSMERNSRSRSRRETCSQTSIDILR